MRLRRSCELAAIQGAVVSLERPRLVHDLDALLGWSDPRNARSPVRASFWSRTVA